MPKIFVATAEWANFFVRSEPHHAKTVQMMQEWHQNKAELITTNYVLTELVALMTSPLRVPRGQVIQAITLIKTAEWIQVLHIEPRLDEFAWEL